MKKKMFFPLMACIAFVMTGCATTQTSSKNQGAFGEHLRTPVKDFVSMGLVFTETLLTINSLTGTSQGQIFTYQALLKEAHSIGADAIINVVIDKKTQATGNDLHETWYGSALAIRYTDTLMQTGIVTVTTEGGSTIKQTTSIYFNDGVGTGQNDGISADAAGESRFRIGGVRQ